MKYELGIALRYLTMARKRAHTAFLSIISMLGLGVGVATLLISLSLLSGLQNQIKERLRQTSPELLVEPKGKATITNAPEFSAAARGLGAAVIKPFVNGIAWVADDRQGSGRPARIRSFTSGDEPPAEISFGRRLELPGTPAGRSIFITRDFAAALGVNLGDRLAVVAPRMRLTPFGPVPVVRQYTVERLLPPSGNEKGADVYLPFDEASELFDTGNLPTSLELATQPTVDLEQMQRTLQARFGNLSLKTWKEINHPLFLALRLEKIVMFATISLIIFVAALNLISSLSMLIVEKRPQVGVLRTLGASETSVLKIFLSVGLLIGLVGTAAGDILGLTVSWAADRYQLIPLPSDVYSVSHIPFTIDPLDVIGVNAVAVILSVIATWYPSRMASRLDPIVAIRDE